MKLKKNDNVIVIAGKDKGKSGQVVRVLPKENKIIISGVNVLKKHQRARKAGEKGQVVEKTLPIHASNAMLVDPDTKKPARVGKKLVGGKMVRISRKSGKEV